MQGEPLSSVPVPHPYFDGTVPAFQWLTGLVINLCFDVGVEVLNASCRNGLLTA